MPFKDQKRRQSGRPADDRRPVLSSWLGGAEREPDGSEADAAVGDDVRGENSAPATLLAGVFDLSGSVSDEAKAITGGMRAMADTVAAHAVARWCVEVSMAVIGSPPHVAPFRPAGEFVVPAVGVSGSSPYGSTLEKVIAELKARRAALSRAGVELNRAVAAVVGDWHANADAPGHTARVVEEWRALQAKGSMGLVCFPVCVGGSVDADFMARLSVSNRPKHLKDFNWRSLFYWLSQAVISVSVSQPGEAVTLPPTDSWSA